MKKYSLVLQSLISEICGSRKKAKKWLKKTSSKIYHFKNLNELSEKELTNELELVGHIICP